MNAVEIRDLYKSYEGGKIKALNGINLTIADGEFVSLIGPSGSGKSTLLNMLGALDVPDSGSISVAGEDLASSKKLNEFRGEKNRFHFPAAQSDSKHFSCGECGNSDVHPKDVLKGDEGKGIETSR